MPLGQTVETCLPKEIAAQACVTSSPPPPVWATIRTRPLSARTHRTGVLIAAILGTHRRKDGTLRGRDGEGMLTWRPGRQSSHRIGLRRVFPLLSKVGLLAAVGLATVPACAPQAQVLVFTSDRGGNRDLFTIDLKTKAQTNLTPGAQDEHSAALSPDGAKIAYVVGMPPQMRVEVVGLDAKKSPQKTIAQGEVYTDVRWAPDSRRIAYGVLVGGALKLMVADTGVESPRPLDITPLPVRDVGGWSKDGEWLLFSTQLGTDQGIYARNPGGVNQVRLSSGPDYSPRWSPDGKYVAFLSTRDGNPEVYAMLANGSELRRLTRTDGEESEVAWSPGSDRLAFVSRTDGKPEIYTVDLRGEKAVRLTVNEVDDLSPVWSKDGRRIAFTSYLHGHADIFLMDPDGKKQERITSDPQNETQPVW